MQARRHVNGGLEPKLNQKPGCREQDKQVAFLGHSRKSAEHDKREQCNNGEANNDAELLPSHRENEICVGVWEDILYRALARAAPPQPTIGESFDRAIDLIAIAGRR